ncbi:MAG: transglutaminase-like domain-containing protein [Candidatus Hadarchaeota archaeon]
MKSAVIVLVAAASVALVFSAYFVTQMIEAENQQITTIRKGYLPKMIRRSKLLLQKENFQQLSPYQAYVTPNDSAVQTLASGSTKQQAYSTAVQWVWVSDTTLNGISEKWLMPSEFLTNTPSYPTNPAAGHVASDCEEQAYTLVSLIRAIGTSASDVRVVVGQVNFNGEIGGHAWVEVYEGGRWLALEATSGPYWDDEDGRLYQSSGYPYYYFLTHTFPSLEVWGYFNDTYYYNPTTGQGNAPASWRTLSAA